MNEPPADWYLGALLNACADQLEKTDAKEHARLISRCRDAAEALLSTAF